MFKLVVLLAISSTTILGFFSENSNYTTKYDNVDLESIVKNERFLKNYINCLLEKGRCTPDGLELRENMPDALKTSCSKCSERQKDGTNFIVHFLVENKPEYFAELEKKYDPEGVYKRKYHREHIKNDVNSTEPSSE